MSILPEIWIKICGITRPQDALAAVESGTDAIGLVFYPPSPRAVSLEQARKLVVSLNSQQRAAVKIVALFVNPTESEVRAVSESGLVDLLQFHGQEGADFCASFGVPYMKAISVESDGDQEIDELAGQLLEKLASYQDAEMILLDSYDKEVPGGTGKTFDWSVAEKVNAKCTNRIVVAGGLNPHNVSEAIAQVSPFGVDVSGGVELSPGVKDASKIELFVRGARSV